MKNMNHWQFSENIRSTLPAYLAPWILYSGSFMERLKEHGIHASIQVLREVWQEPLAEERNRLGVGSDTLIREVLITFQDIHLMYARTVFSSDILAVKKSLNHLENNSLGSVLFKDPNMRRSEFEVISLQSGMFWFEKIKEYVKTESDPIWARRSIFHLQDKSLLLTETFLPGMKIACK